MEPPEVEVGREVLVDQAEMVLLVAQVLLVALVDRAALADQAEMVLRVVRAGLAA